MSTGPDLGHIPALAPHELAGGFVAVLVAMLAFFRWMLTLAGGRQDKRIAKLEAEAAQNANRLMAITQALFEVMAVLERHEPHAPALNHARAVLTKSFPADAPDHHAP